MPDPDEKSVEVGVPENQVNLTKKFRPAWATENGPLSPSIIGASGFSANNLAENIGRKYMHKTRGKTYQVMDIVWNDDTDDWNILIAECLFRDRTHGIKITVTLTALVNKFVSLST